MLLFSYPTASVLVYASAAVIHCRPGGEGEGGCITSDKAIRHYLGHLHHKIWIRSLNRRCLCQNKFPNIPGRRRRRPPKEEHHCTGVDDLPQVLLEDGGTLFHLIFILASPSPTLINYHLGVPSAHTLVCLQYLLIWTKFFLALGFKMYEFVELFVRLLDHYLP